MIPRNRRVTPNDLIRVAELLGIPRHDLSWVFGKSPAIMGKLIHTDVREEPVHDEMVSILTRLLDEDPDLVPVARPPSYREMYTIVKEYEPELTEGEFAIYMGQHPATGYSRIRSTIGDTTEDTPTMIRAFDCLNKLIQRDGAKGWKRWKDYVLAEAKCRGLDVVGMRNGWGSRKRRAGAAG